MKKQGIAGSWRSIRVYEYLGIRVESAARGKARLRLPWREEFTQPLGYTHGGIIACLADAAAGWALFPVVKNPRACTTLQMQINYLSPVLGKDMVATASVVRQGRTTAVMDVDVRAGRKLCAKSLVTYHIRQ